jgi:hypothetical protein
MKIYAIRLRTCKVKVTVDLMEKFNCREWRPCLITAPGCAAYHIVRIFSLGYLSVRQDLLLFSGNLYRREKSSIKFLAFQDRRFCKRW